MARVEALRVRVKARLDRDFAELANRTIEKLESSYGTTLHAKGDDRAKALLDLESVLDAIDADKIWSWGNDPPSNGTLD